MINLKPDQMSRPALIQRVVDLESEISRMRGSLTESGHRNSRLRSDKARLKVIARKKKGEIDAVGRKRVKEMMGHTILSNCISNVIWIPSAIAAGEYSHMMLLAAVTTSVLQPIQMYIQKRQEVH
jgi:hypothetical protein